MDLRSSLFLCLSTSATLLSLCDARMSRQTMRSRIPVTDPDHYYCVSDTLIPSATKFTTTRPAAPEFLPPVVFPPPLLQPPPPPPPKNERTLPGLWCVAKPTVPDPIIQEAMDYACGSGADCRAVEPGGPCYQPDTLIAHASFAFNSYWQRTKVAGGTCDFEGIALLVTSDPSYGGCYFFIY